MVTLQDELNLEQEYKNLGMQAKIKELEQIRINNSGVDACNQPLGHKFMRLEFDDLCKEVKNWMLSVTKPKRGVVANYIPILQGLMREYKEVDELVSMMTLTAYSMAISAALKNSTGNFSLNIATAIGKGIHDEAGLNAYIKWSKDNTRKNQKGIENGVQKRNQPSYRNAYVNALERHDNFKYPAWSKDATQSLGASVLYVILIASNYFDDDAAKEARIAPSQTLLEAWDRNSHNIIEHASKYCPMIVVPKPWVSFDEGGYYGVLANDVTLLRIDNRRGSFFKNYMKRLSQFTLKTPLAALNAIQSTPWRIHKQTLEVAQFIMKQGGGRAGIPYIDNQPKPAVLPADPTEAQIKEYSRIMTKFYETEAARRSVALRSIYTLKTAERFSEYDKMYFPCNMDFRGRIYPIPVFNFQGDDLTKGLIELTDVPPLSNPKDIKWFYIVGANHAGVDKVSFDDRIKWVMDNKEHILASANDPLGYTWWEEQDEPWQFLQWCFEFKRLMEYTESHNGDPTGFVTGTVVAFDGTCSGLQHYSALLRDPVGAEAVNLIPQSKPNDIYRIVSDKVNVQLNKDVKEGTEDEEAEKDGYKYTRIGTKTMALIWLTHGVNRKVTKRCVMTLAYGSKQYGFGNQLMEDIIKPDIQADDKSPFNGHAQACAKYLAKLIWDAVSTTVIKAVEGMKWLQECTRMVTKHGQVVSWVTPAGLLVQQQYLEYKMSTHWLRIMGTRLRLYSSEVTGEVDKRHQASGIAPNFIHSLDASHLQITVEKCAHKGIKHFATVHDSYGTCLEHAGILNKTVKECFYDMYTQYDIIENFREDLQYLTDQILPEPPKKSSLELSCVMNSDYIFS